MVLYTILCIVVTLNHTIGKMIKITKHTWKIRGEGAQNRVLYCKSTNELKYCCFGYEIWYLHCRFIQFLSLIMLRSCSYKTSRCINSTLRAHFRWRSNYTQCGIITPQTIFCLWWMVLQIYFLNNPTIRY